MGCYFYVLCPLDIGNKVMLTVTVLRKLETVYTQK